MMGWRQKPWERGCQASVALPGSVPNPRGTAGCLINGYRLGGESLISTTHRLGPLGQMSLATLYLRFPISQRGGNNKIYVIRLSQEFKGLGHSNVQEILAIYHYYYYQVLLMHDIV